MIKAPAQPDAILARMDSLADATRLRLLRLLERHELGVVELCEVLQLPQSTVSRHLKVLSDQSWIVNRRSGTTNLYHMIADELDPSARRLWTLAREQTEPWATLHQDQVRLLRLLRDKKLSGGGGAEAFFAGAAGQWDKLRQELYGSSFGTSALLALLPSEWTVADLGCGTGATSAELAGHVKQVIGVDQSEAMLKAARKRTADLGNVELKRGDLETLPIDDGACDAALLLLVLTYVADPAAVLAEMARVIRSGGKAVVVDLMSHDREDFRRKMDQRCLGFAEKELSRLLEQAGFVNVTCRPLLPEPNAKGPALLLATGMKNV